MKSLLHIPFFIFLIISINGFAQGTFSMVAVDSLTGEVGSAGASCVDYVAAGLESGRIGDPIPGLGAINTQADTDTNNQQNARTRMLAGDSPQEIIDWLVSNDVDSDATVRQYGVVDLNGGQPRSAAHTGSNCFDYKNHILGPNYSIQGNILLAQTILDSMEARFLSAEGDLACKLMAALQGAKKVGADIRCNTNGTSALYAYVKVALPTDSLDNPSFILKVKTSGGAGIEPVDSLQIMFNNAKTCADTTAINNIVSDEGILIYPSPAASSISIEYKTGSTSKKTCLIRNVTGQQIFEAQFMNSLSIDIAHWKAGMYFVQITGKDVRVVSKMVKR